MANELEDALVERLRALAAPDPAHEDDCEGALQARLAYALALDAKRTRLETELSTLLEAGKASISEMALLLREIAEVKDERLAAIERARELQPPEPASA